MIKIYADEYEELIRLAAEAALRKIGNRPEDVDVEITVTDEDGIKTLNREKRGVDAVTDVLSFQNLSVPKLPLDKKLYPSDINFDDGSVIIGEIFICAQRAREQAEEYGHGIEREICFLTCHGMLHLLGFDHQTEEDEKKMMSLTEEILSSIGRGKQPADGGERNDGKNEQLPPNFKSGFVAIIGRPNAGKSTLINAVVGEKVAIVSWKPQTTRNKILGIYNGADCQIVFIDTPGLYRPRNTLGEYMMKSAKAATEGVDCVLYVIDAEKGYDASDKENILGYLNGGLKVVAAVNKVDHVLKSKVIEILTELNKFQKLSAVVPISALRNRNIEPLVEEIKKLLTDNVKYYDDESYTDKNMRFMTAEIIREKALRLLDKEVPYGIGVEVTKYALRSDGKIIDINADIICEKEAHKPIILGKGGAMIKKIATYARMDIEDITGVKVFLTLFVRVESDWRANLSIMKNLGYDPKELN
jgi:GTP-binding protein Era